jgi:hypothetical protein
MTTPGRISHERLLLDVLRESLNDLPDAEIYSGLKPENRFGLAGWELALIQRFQFGDLRVELPHCTVVVEVESAGASATSSSTGRYSRRRLCQSASSWCIYSGWLAKATTSRTDDSGRSLSSACAKISLPLGAGGPKTGRPEPSPIATRPRASWDRCWTSFVPPAAASTAEANHGGFGCGTLHGTSERGVRSRSAPR